MYKTLEPCDKKLQKIVIFYIAVELMISYCFKSFLFSFAGKAMDKQHNPGAPPSSAYLTIFIRRVTLNTELDTVFLFVRHGQRTHFGVYPLVCPFSTWPGQGFYVELFLLVLLIGFRDGKETKPFWLKPLHIKEMFYAFSQKNKVFYEI